MITLYGTVVCEAENKEQAKKILDTIIDGLQDNLSIEPLLIGDVEKAGQIYRMENGKGI